MKKLFFILIIVSFVSTIIGMKRPYYVEKNDIILKKQLYKEKFYLKTPDGNVKEVLSDAFWVKNSNTIKNVKKDYNNNFIGKTKQDAFPVMYSNYKIDCILSILDNSPKKGNFNINESQEIENDCEYAKMVIKKDFNGLSVLADEHEQKSLNKLNNLLLVVNFLSYLNVKSIPSWLSNLFKDIPSIFLSFDDIEYFNKLKVILPIISIREDEINDDVVKTIYHAKTDTLVAQFSDERVGYKEDGNWVYLDIEHVKKIAVTGDDSLWICVFSEHNDECKISVFDKHKELFNTKIGNYKIDNTLLQLINFEENIQVLVGGANCFAKFTILAELKNKKGFVKLNVNEKSISCDIFHYSESGSFVNLKYKNRVRITDLSNNNENIIIKNILLLDACKKCNRFMFLCGNKDNDKLLRFDSFSKSWIEFYSSITNAFCLGCEKNNYGLGKKRFLIQINNKIFVCIKENGFENGYKFMGIYGFESIKNIICMTKNIFVVHGIKKDSNVEKIEIIDFFIINKENDVVRRYPLFEGEANQRIIDVSYSREDISWSNPEYLTILFKKNNSEDDMNLEYKTYVQKLQFNPNFFE